VSLQLAGLVLAIVTFATIGIGHIFVRGLHARFGTLPAIPFFLLGLLILFFSLMIAGDLFSAALGITAITLVWDGVEIFRQEKRVRASRAGTPRDGDRESSQS
jgi:hypothetical protein